MLFTKSAPVVSRSALAKSKKFWSATQTSNQAPASPGFFVSTPQFTRHQQSQLIPYEDSRGAGNSNTSGDSHGIDNPYLALTAGSNANGAPGLYYDEDKKDEQPSRVSSQSVVSPLNSSQLRKTTSLTDLEAAAELESESVAALLRNNGKDPVAEAIDQVGKRAVVDGMLEKMSRLHAAGSHSDVLATFEVLEAIQHSLPVEAYNLVLECLASTCNTETLLEAYEKMLARGVHPNEQTYYIILKSLAESAEKLAQIRRDLKPYLGSGNGTLESVDEIYEGLAVEEYLVLSQNLLQALIATHPQPWGSAVQECLERIIHLSIEFGLAVPEPVLKAANKDLVDMIDVQPSIESAAEQFSSLSPEAQHTEQAQAAMMRSYFRYKQPSGAIAFYSGCGAPAYLLKPLLTGFAASGMVATARLWVEKSNASTELVDEVLAAIPNDNTVNASDVLPSATMLFNRLVAGGGNGSGSANSANSADNGSAVGESESEGESMGRCAFLRLCVSAQNWDTLIMAIRESHLSNSTWDAVTIAETVDFVCQRNEPLLAADLCAWQVPKLIKVYEQKNLKGFVDQEIVSNLVYTMQHLNQLSLDASLRLLPVVNRCKSACEGIVEMIASAKLGAPHELSSIMTPDRLSDLVSNLAGIMNSVSSPISSEKMALLQRVFPLLVEDALVAKSEFSLKNALSIKEALLHGNAESLLSIWEKKQIEGRSQETLSPSEASTAIQRYALSPHGLDLALDLLRDQLRLNRAVSQGCIDAVINGCVSQNMGYILGTLYDILPTNPSTLNSLIVASMRAKTPRLAERCVAALKSRFGAYPTHASYLELIRGASKDPALALSLFNEAAQESNVVPDSDMYNALITVLASHGKQPEVDGLIEAMESKGFKLTIPAHESILDMHLRLGNGQQCLTMLKQMPMATKSLLGVATFNSLMRHFVRKSADRNAALEVFTELRDTGTLATPTTYGLLMEAYLLRSEDSQPSLERADRVLAMMRKDGAPITAQCCATLLRARGVQFRDFAGAKNFYRGMIKNSRILPDKGVFKALLDSYITNGKQSEASQVIDEMKRYHIPLDDEMSKIASLAAKT